MSDAGVHHAAFVARMRDSVAVPPAILDAFERVPRHLFVPKVGADAAYADEAIVTHDVDGVPTSSSSQPSLMARMLDLLDLAPGDRVLEIGAGTGYNAALLDALGADVTTVELQPEVAEAAREHLAAAGARAEVVTGDGADPPPGPFDRIIVTAGVWALPEALVGALAEGGVLVAPLRINAIEAVFALRREGEVLHGAGALPCGFMPLRGGGEARPWRWRLGAGGGAMADTDLGNEGRGNLDRLLATRGREVEDPLAATGHPLDAMLWVALQGDPLLSLALPTPSGPPGWALGLDVLPASLLVLEFAGSYADVASVRLHGSEAALRSLRSGIAGWKAAGSPRPSSLALAVEPHRERSVWSLPYPDRGGGSTLYRGAHRWTLRYAADGASPAG
jgi:protein-L-isoaspartate(D-aspartate) O-methyltransferase